MNTVLQDKADLCHSMLTKEKREYWHKRGVTDDWLDALKVGWSKNGDWEWYVFPIFDFDGRILFFKLKKAGTAENQPRSMALPKGNRATLYPLPYLHRGIDKIFLCEGEPDCLALLTHEMEAISSTAGVHTFPDRFLDHFPKGIKVVCCFDNDEAGEKGREKVSELFKRKRPDITFSSFHIPAACPGKDMTDFFLWTNG